MVLTVVRVDEVLCDGGKRCSFVKAFAARIHTHVLICAESKRATFFTLACEFRIDGFQSGWNRDETFATNAVERDIGHVFARPVVDDTSPHFTNQIARLNNGRWAVVMGNGYNSTNERPVLLIQYLSGSDTSIKTIPAAAVGSANAASNTH